MPGVHDDCCIYLKLRHPDGKLLMEEVRAVRLKDETFLKSEMLAEYAFQLPDETEYLLLFIEGSPKAARCVITPATGDLFELVSSAEPTLRLSAYDVPPVDFTTIEAEEIYTAFHDLVASGDAELFGTNAEQFVHDPHILVPLFAHVLSLSSKENIDFPLILRTTAEQLRLLLTSSDVGPVRIQKIRRNHAQFWSEVIGERIAFADGGVARISGVPSAEPLALRVGVYSVCPGEADLDKREDWHLAPYVLGDLVQDVEGGGAGEPPDRKRLQEAARYVLEPLTALRYVEDRKDIAFLFLHGPLVNQFTQYDEGEPNFIPCLDPDFLRKHGITEDSTIGLLSGIPRTPRGAVLWNQFMAVYGVVMQNVYASSVPMVGVVERTAGRWLTRAVLDSLVEERRITVNHAKKIKDIVERFDISDDFLFGCVLQEGEYLNPIRIPKNPPRRARERWQEVVKQYPSPYATILKTSASNFPYRIEMNSAAFGDAARVLRLLYHTSRLLPRYAFPVGLDIVDKYAKVPDWLSRGVSARIAADVLLRALQTGDSNIVAQVRQFLARTPRDFFYRPQA